MNIPGDLQRILQTQETYQTSAAADKTTTLQAVTAEHAAPSDQAHLSAAANIVNQSVGQADVRTDKVASVQASIAGGNYRVDSSQVADSLINHMLGGGQ